MGTRILVFLPTTQSCALALALGQDSGSNANKHEPRRAILKAVTNASSPSSFFLAGHSQNSLPSKHLPRSAEALQAAPCSLPSVLPWVSGGLLSESRQPLSLVVLVCLLVVTFPSLDLAQLVSLKEILGRLPVLCPLTTFRTFFPSLLFFFFFYCPSYTLGPPVAPMISLSPAFLRFPNGDPQVADGSWSGSSIPPQEVGSPLSDLAGGLE